MKIDSMQLMIGAVLVIGSMAGAQSVPRYQIVDLGDLSNGNDHLRSFAFGINDDNIVVGMAEDSLNRLQAFIWLPWESRYGIGSGSAGFNSTLNSHMWPLGTNITNNLGQSVAYDINEQGWIVGSSDYTTNTYRGFLWNPAALDGSSNPWAANASGRKTMIDAIVGDEARAHAITNVRNDGTDDFVIVAGVTLDDDTPDDTDPEVVHNCKDSLFGTNPKRVARGYSTRIEVDPPPTLHTILSTERRAGGADTLGDQDFGQSWAMAVANQGPTDYVTGGITYLCPGLMAGTDCGDSPTPVFWTDASEFDPSLMDTYFGSTVAEYDGRVYDISDAGEFVGRLEDFVPLDHGCTIFATYWASKNAAPTNIDTGACAFAIHSTVSPSTMIRVVGTATSVDYFEPFYPMDASTDPFEPDADLDIGSDAMLWESTNGTSWTATVLQDAIHTECEGNDGGEWQLHQAFDINENGWIVGHGTRYF
jgi:probable HAF family extracellular repeat protein